MSTLRKKLHRCKRSIRRYFFDHEFWKELNSKKSKLEFDDYIKLLKSQ